MTPQRTRRAPRQDGSGELLPCVRPTTMRQPLSGSIRTANGLPLPFFSVSSVSSVVQTSSAARTEPMHWWPSRFPTEKQQPRPSKEITTEDTESTEERQKRRADFYRPTNHNATTTLRIYPHDKRSSFAFFLRVLCVLCGANLFQG